MWKSFIHLIMDKVKMTLIQLKTRIIQNRMEAVDPYGTSKDP